MSPSNANVSYSPVGGGIISVTVGGGSSTGTTTPSKQVSQYVYSSVNSFSSTISYNSGGYTGSLSKDGSSYVYSGSYTPSQSQTFTRYVSNTVTSTGRTNPWVQDTYSQSNPAPSCYSINENGYSGCLTRRETAGGGNSTVYCCSYYDSVTKTTRQKWSLSNTYTARYSDILTKIVLGSKDHIRLWQRNMPIR